MVVELKPETEKLVREEIQSGHFHTLDDLIQETVQLWREKHQVKPGNTRKNLADFLLESPFAGSDLDLERDNDSGREVGL